MAGIRGDRADRAALMDAARFARTHHVDCHEDLEALLAASPITSDEDLIERLRLTSQSPVSAALASAVAGLPADLRWLLESGAVTIEQLAALHEGLGVTSATDLGAAVADRAIRSVPGLDDEVEAAVSRALEHLRRGPRLPLGRAVAIAEPILERLRAAPGVKWAEPGGSLRRGDETVGDIELVAAATDAAAGIEAVLELDDVNRTLHRGERRLYVRVDRVQVGIRLPEPADAGLTLLRTTGSPSHVYALGAHANARGWTLRRDELRDPRGSRKYAATEEEVYGALGLPFIPPELRDGEEAVDAARRGSLPNLLGRSDIRGDLHMHTDWSDGRDSVEAMVASCRALGYDYVAITDHSPHSAALRNLTENSLWQQADEIARVRELYPDIVVLHGCEVDILPDGRLDFPDRVLERLDIVLASLHEGAGQTREQLFQRYLAAMNHPFVSLITHPTNRALPHRPGYDLEYGRLFEAAAETGTIVEVDGAPAHLDLNGPLVREATAAGATIAVDSDCHRAELLGRQMDLGVITARRGWVEARHVVNTRRLEQVREFIAAKRAR